MKTAYDVIIVGTGAAGLFTALSLPPHLQILMITKDTLLNSDSYLAQGGISTLLNEQDYDSYFEDTMRAGRYENKEESVHIMIESSRQIILDLLHYGVDFDRDCKGNLNYTREGAHSCYRILHHKDITGQEIVSKLLKKVNKKPNITILEYATMIDILTCGQTCYGIIIRTKSNTIEAIYGHTTVLATGGIGGLFQSTTNFSHITGDSFGIALRHNIETQDLNYIQIHPTVLHSKKAGRRFLISESVRGEGAILLNERKERFVDELLPRDVVTEAIRKEMETFHTDHVYLSLPSMSEPDIKRRFPTIYERCLEEGYHLGRDLIPVSPAQHYLMGGIKTDVNGATSMHALYAVGETACNGVHGANRLASNSLLESLVFAKRAAKQLIGHSTHIPDELVIDFSLYDDLQAYERENRALVINELKRKDTEFYAKWCNAKN